MLSVVDDARELALDGHAAWPEAFNEMFAQVAGVFGNASVRRRGRGYLLGLLSHAERENSWQLAGLAGAVSPDGMQRLLDFSPWDEDAARDALARYVARTMGDPAAVLAVDETGFLKKGRMPAGVARMHAGTAGRVENCQAGVFAAYVTPDGGRALIGRELYLPEKRTGGRDRCRAAGTGDEVAFATRPKPAEKMIARAREAGIPFAWVAGDEAYGGNPGLRQWLEGQEVPYVMATACSDAIGVAAGPMRADELAALVPAAGWQRLSRADGSKGPRLHDWALIATGSPRHRLLVRRSLQPGEKGQLELAFFRCWPPRPVTLPELVAVAGARWGVEDCFAEAKGEAGLDHYQARKYRAWYRHVTLAMLAHAFLAVTARASRPDPPPRQSAAASGNEQATTAKKGSWHLRTAVRAAQDMHPSGIRDRRNRTRPHPAHRRRGPPPVQPPRPRHLAQRIPSALVTLATLPPGQRPQIPLRPTTQRSQVAVVVLAAARGPR